MTAAEDPAEQAVAVSDSASELEDFDNQRFEDEYKRAKIERYEAPCYSASPRQQVLAGLVCLDHEEETRPWFILGAPTRLHTRQRAERTLTA